MGRYERNQFFEALVGLRDGYATLPDDDRRSTLLVDDAVVYAEAVMKALDAEEDLAGLIEDAGIEAETLPQGESRD